MLFKNKKSLSKRRFIVIPHISPEKGTQRNVTNKINKYNPVNRFHPFDVGVV